MLMKSRFFRFSTLFAITFFTFIGNTQEARAGKTIVISKFQPLQSLNHHELSLFISLKEESQASGIIDRSQLSSRELSQIVKEKHSYHPWVLTDRGVQCLCKINKITYSPEILENPWTQESSRNLKESPFSTLDERKFKDLFDSSVWDHAEKTTEVLAEFSSENAWKDLSSDSKSETQIFCGCLESPSSIRNF